MKKSNHACREKQTWRQHLVWLVIPQICYFPWNIHELNVTVFIQFKKHNTHFSKLGIKWHLWYKSRNHSCGIKLEHFTLWFSLRDSAQLFFMQFLDQNTSWECNFIPQCGATAISTSMKVHSNIKLIVFCAGSVFKRSRVKSKLLPKKTIFQTDNQWNSLQAGC